MDRLSWLTSLSIWLVLGMTSVLVTSHVSLLWLLRLYKYEQIHPVTWYLVVLFLLTGPCLAELVYWFWTTPIINTCARGGLPSARHICLGLLSSTLEGAALAAFGAEVAHALPEPVLLTLPFSVLAFDILRDTMAHMKSVTYGTGEKSTQLSPYRRAIPVVFSGLLAIYPLMITGLVGTLLCLWSQFEFSPAQCAVITTSTFLLSTIWDPEVMSLTFLSSDGTSRCSRVQMIYAVVKTAASAITLFLSLAFKVGLFRKYPCEHIMFALGESSQMGVFVPIVLCCFGGLFSFLLCVATSKVCLTTPVVQVSMFLSPMLAIIVSAVLWKDFETGAFWEVTADDFVSWLAVVLSSGAWLAPLFAPAFKRLGNPASANRKLPDSFYSFTWSLFFLEPRIVINYEKSAIPECTDAVPQRQERENPKRNSDRKTVFICTTMYKETEAEMSRYVRSIKSTFDHAWEQENTKVEAHVVFDSSVSDGEVNLRGRHFLGLLCEMFGFSGIDLLKFSTPYGCQIQVPRLAKDFSMFIHFKDATKVKAKKRWSQVMYMHYVLKVRTGQSDCLKANGCELNGKARIYSSSATTFGPSTNKSVPQTNIRSDGKHDSQKSSRVPRLGQVYVLTTDADTEFSASCVSRVLSVCAADPSLGAVCGRTVPKGSAKPIVWYQKFEYAKDFWLVKSSQNIIGSVTCCPGCFSIYRGEALSGVVNSFSQPAQSAFQSLVMDHGEDRWLCTLLMQQGWRLAYSCSARNSTHCPETVGEFLRQRRRWVLSELFNMAAIFLSVRSLVRENSSFSVAFLMSLFTTLLWVIVSPATTLVCVCAGMAVLCSVPLAASLPIATAIFAGYCIVCWFGSQRKQKVASLGLTLVMATAVLTLSISFLIFVAKKIQEDASDVSGVKFRPYLMVLLLSGYALYAALLHPREVYSLVYGLAYALLFPAIFVALPVYALSNMLDQSWGTREAGTRGCCQKPEVEESQEDFTDYAVRISDLPSLSTVNPDEGAFWHKLCNTHIGNDVSVGKCPIVLGDGMRRLRGKTMLLFLAANCFWALGLAAMYVFVGSDVICYLLMGVFSFSLVLQLTGLTCHKASLLLEKYLCNTDSAFRHSSL